MLSKNDIIRILSENKHYIDEFILEAFIKNWKIEAIYEDENGVEYYDEAALEKVRNALCDKSELQKEACEIEIIDKEPLEEQEQTVVSEESYAQAEPVSENIEEKISSNIEIIETSAQPFGMPARGEQELKNVTLNITNQTLNVLAQTIAEKITGDISGYLKKTDFLEEALSAGSFKRDNEILATKMQELLQDNRILIKKIQELEKDKDAYLHVVANIYVKKPR